jgi:Fe-S-cluster containining protein
MARSCGGCNACCDVLVIDDPQLSKPAGKLCPHWTHETKCTLYSRRPQTCRNFTCLWINGYGRPNERPDRIGALLGQPIAETPSPDLALQIKQELISAPEAFERLQNRNHVARVWEVKPGGCSRPPAIDFAKAQLEAGNHVLFGYRDGRRVLYCPMNKLPLQGADFEVKWYFEL